MNGPPDPAPVGTSLDRAASDDPAAGLSEQEAAARAAAGRDDADRSLDGATVFVVLGIVLPVLMTVATMRVVRRLSD